MSLSEWKILSAKTNPFWGTWLIDYVLVSPTWKVYNIDSKKYVILYLISLLKSGYFLIVKLISSKKYNLIVEIKMWIFLISSLLWLRLSNDFLCSEKNKNMWGPLNSSWEINLDFDSASKKSFRMMDIKTSLWIEQHLIGLCYNNKNVIKGIV